MNWKLLTDLDTLKEIKSDSSLHVLTLIFKHSTRCSISKMVLSRFERENKGISMNAFFLDLLMYRDISNQISEDYDIKHESPQLLIIKGGQCIAHANHNAINQLDLSEYL